MSKILAVDDSVTMRNLFNSTLSEAGFEVCLAEDGNKALELAKEQRFELILTDVNMPGMDGISLVRQIRQLPECRHTPILIVTTQSEPELKQKGREAGATGWIVKPFDPIKLLATVKRVL